MAFDCPPEGTRRLRLALGGLAVALLLAGYAVVLVVYARPSWAGWWAVMAALLVIAFFAARAVAHLVEWVMAAYRR